MSEPTPSADKPIKGWRFPLFQSIRPLNRSALGSQFRRRHIVGGSKHSPGLGLRQDCRNAGDNRALHIAIAGGSFRRFRIVALPGGSV